MQIIFRKNLTSDGAHPDPGEIFIQPEMQRSTVRRQMAMLVLEHDINCLKSGGGPINFVVVDANPTLDDLLAAEFAARLLSGEELPKGCAAFARYAALAREGLFPSTVPLEASLEGVYLAIRNGHGQPLHDPEVGRRVASDWARVAAVIMAAARSEQDPFSTALFAGPEFARERAFLASDNHVYHQDVTSGCQWFVHLPSGPPRTGALILHSPKSLLFKHWSRREQQIHVAGTVSLLIVDRGDGHWIFSTDPVYRLSLLSLAEQLQAAEFDADPVGATADPWFDGRPFQLTMIAAPRAGTRLSKNRVLRIVRKWAHAKDPRPRWLLPSLAAAIVLFVIAAVGLAKFHRASEENVDRGLERLEISEETVRSPAGKKGKDYAYLFACDQYQHWPPLSNAEKDAAEIDNILRDQYGFESHFNPRLNRDAMWDVLSECRNIPFEPYDQLFIYVSGHGATYNNCGYIVAPDSEGDKNDGGLAKLTKSMVPLSELKTLLERSNCKHFFVVLDICYGGQIDFGAVERGKRATGKVVYAPKDQFIIRKLKPTCRLYLTSVGDHTASDGQPGQHSPFALAMIKSFNEEGKVKGVVTATKIASDVEGLAQGPQTGILDGHQLGGDFLFIHR